MSTLRLAGSDWSPLPSPEVLPGPVFDARAWATEQHGDQRYGDLPYLAHLDHVVEVLQRFGYGEETDLLIAAYLHDVIEDAGETRASVAEAWGEKQGLLAWLLTTPDAARWVARTRLLNIQWKHTKRSPNASLAATVKLADRIANVEASWATKHRILFTYREEHRDFRRALRDHTRPSEDAMWRWLDKLMGV